MEVLPSLALHKVFSFLSQSDKNNCRLVCKSWVFELDRYVGHSILLHDREPNSVGLLKIDDFRIHTCSIICMRKMNSYWELPESIEYSRKLNLCSPMRSALFKLHSHFPVLCCLNISKECITGSKYLVPSRQKMKSPLYMPVLRNLKIGISYNIKPKLMNNLGQNMLGIFEALYAPNLIGLKVICAFGDEGNQQLNIVESGLNWELQIWSFLQGHQSIREIQLEIRLPIFDDDSFDLIIPNREIDVLKLDFLGPTLLLLHSLDEQRIYWSRLTFYQTKLRSVNLWNTGLEWYDIKNILMINHHTLEEFRVASITLPLYGVQIDCEVFSPCVNLRKLTLCGFCSSSYIINFHLLPNSIESFEAACINIPNAEVHKLKKLPNLKHIRFGLCGHQFDCGVTMDALLSLMRNRTINHITIEEVTLTEETVWLLRFLIESTSNNLTSTNNPSEHDDSNGFQNNGNFFHFLFMENGVKLGVQSET